MSKIEIKYPIALLSSDLHLTNKKPKCRLDNFFETVITKFVFLCNFANELEIPIVVSGDFCDEAEWPDWLLRYFINLIFEKEVYILVVPGQHDLINHNITKWEDGALGVLHASGSVEVVLTPKNYGAFTIIPFPFGIKIKNVEDKYLDDNLLIAVAHQMVINYKPLWPGQEAPKGEDLLKQFPEYDVILTGDNHNQFVISTETSHLINPGSMLRLNADQMDHEPRFWIWFNNNEIKEVPFPIQPAEDVMTREHIEEQNKKNAQLQSYMEKIRNNKKVTLSYTKNLEKFFANNTTRKEIIELTWEHTKEKKN